MRSAIKILFLFWFCVLISAGLSNAQVRTITQAIPPVSPYINQAFTTSGPGIRASIINTYGEPLTINLYGSLERLSPSHFSINVINNTSNIVLQAGETKFLSSTLLQEAFANFNMNDLALENITLDALQEGPNYKLPEGFYNICFYVKINGDIIESSRSCATFYICGVSAPQFTQPVNNMMVNPNITVVQPVSPFVFSWTPPQSSCSFPVNTINYNFELREIFEGQSITDAINNPIVFQKAGLVTSVFPLDTNLYPHVLQVGKKYIMQVQARATGNPTPPSIENNGYSRVEAFQYGNGVSIADQYIIPEPEEYYIPFEERKTDFWDDIFAGYLNKSRTDTSAPVREYIAFALMESGIAYNLSAIKLFLSLNPELTIQKTVKLSYKPKLPGLPEMAEVVKQKFDDEHNTNLTQDTAGIARFNQYLDGLSAIRGKVPAYASVPVNDLVEYLNNFKPQLVDLDRVSTGFINEVLAEILFNLNSAQPANANDSARLNSLVAAIKELTAANSSGTSFLNNNSLQTTKSPASRSYNNLLHYAPQVYLRNEAMYSLAVNTYAISTGQLFPVDVVVWRASKSPPNKPVTDAPDLTEAFRVSYILSALYNHKNPQIASHTSNNLASTIQISLPANAVYKFWTRNMLTNGLTQAEDVDIKDIFTNNKKNQKNKKPVILLEVK